MRFNTQAKTLLAGCALAALTVPAAAFAQDAAGATDSGGMEEIVVTAQRRTERLENVPMAVTALTSGALERAQVQNVHEISRIAPGVQINFGGVSTQPAIRGITSLTNGTGNENNVAIYVDGFYVSDNLTINQDLANLQSIQVLKGPQGTLYGRNATGGAILIQTLDPTRELSGKVEGAYGRFSEKKLSGYISGPLTEKIGFMAAGAFRNSDGWIKKTSPTDNTKGVTPFNPQKQRSLRTKLKAELTDDFTATLAYNYAFTSDSSGNNFTVFELVSPVINNINKACCFGLASGNGKNIAAGKSNDGTLTLAWDTGLGTVTSRSGVSRRSVQNDFDFDGSYLDLGFSETRVRFKTFQQSIDYAINAIDNLDLVVGANYFRETTRAISKGYGANRALGFTNQRYLKTQAYAVFADANYHVTDKLTIGVGGRYSNDKKSQALTSTNAVPTSSFAVSETNKSFSKFTPRATVRYEVADRTNVYATVSKGFRSGSFNATASTPAAATLPIKPENITSYEIGFKTAQRWFRAEIAVFYYDYKDLNVALTIPNPLNPSLPTTQTGNADNAKVKGIDGQVVLMPVEKLNITIGAAYVHARYGNFANASGTGVNAAGTANVSGQIQDWSGKQMARAPDFTANFAADYTVDLGETSLRLSGNVKYSDSYVISNPSLFGPLAPVALQNKQRFRQASYTLVDGEITWFGPEERYWVGVYGKNLTNKSYRLTYNGAVYGNYSTKAQPISYGVKVGYKF